MSISSFIHGTPEPPTGQKAEPLDGLAKSVERASKEVLTKRYAFELANTTYSNSLADEIEGHHPEISSDVAERDLERARRELSRAEAALVAVKDPKLNESRRAARAAVAEGWDKAVKLAEARDKAVMQLAQAIKTMAGKYQEVAQLTADLTAALPPQVDRAAARLTADSLTMAIKQRMRKEGIAWADPTRNVGDPAAPDTLTEFNGTPGLIRRWRDAAAERR